MVYLAFIGLPVVALLVRAAQQESFLASLTSPLALQALRLSLFTSAVSMVIVVLVGTPFAHWLARSNSPTLRVVDSLVELPIVLPPVVAGLAMLMAFGRQGLLGPPLSSLAPFYIRSAKLGFQSVSLDYQEVSQTLGVAPWDTFWRLTLPLARSSLLTGLALAWARAISEFGATIMFAGNFPGRTQTLPLAIMADMDSGRGLETALALSVLLLLGAMLVLVALGLLHRRRWREGV